MDSEQSQLNIPSDAQAPMRNSFGQEKKGRLEGSNDDVTLDRVDAVSDQDRVDISHAGVEGRENQRKMHHGRGRRDELNFRDQFRGGLDEQVHLLRNPDYREPGAHEADNVPRHHTKPQESFAPVETENSINRQQYKTEENIQSSERDENVEERNVEQSERSEQSSKDQEQGESEQQQEQENVGIVGRVKEGAQHAIDSVTSSVGRAKDMVVNAMQGVKQRVLGISPSEEGEQEGEQKEEGEKDEGENLSRDVKKLDIQEGSQQEQSEGQQEGQQEGQEEEREQFADVARAQATLFEPLQQRSQVSKPVEEQQQPIAQGGKKKKWKGHRKINPALEMNIDDEEFEDEFEQEDINAGVSEGSQLYLEKKGQYNVQHSQSDNLIGTSGGL